MDGAGGKTGGETEQKGGKGARCRKQVGGHGREGIECQLIWGACEKSRVGEHGVGAGTKRRGRWHACDGRRW